MKNVRPHHLILGFWLVLAGAFGLSGVVSTITQQHDDSPISREVFGNIPSAVKALFYVAVAIAAVVVGKLASDRVKNWERGRAGASASRRRRGSARAGP